VRVPAVLRRLDGQAAERARLPHLPPGDSTCATYQHSFKSTIHTHTHDCLRTFRTYTIVGRRWFVCVLRTACVPWFGCPRECNAACLLCWLVYLFGGAYLPCLACTYLPTSLHTIPSHMVSWDQSAFLAWPALHGCVFHCVARCVYVSIGRSILSAYIHAMLHGWMAEGAVHVRYFPLNACKPPALFIRVCLPPVDIRFIHPSISLWCNSQTPHYQSLNNIHSNALPKTG